MDAIARRPLSPPRSRALRTVGKIVTGGLAGYRARVFLFGSSARGDAVARSDIDVAVLPLDPVPPLVLARIAAGLNECDSPYAVDLVDLTAASPELRSRVLSQGIEWPMP